MLDFYCPELKLAIEAKSIAQESAIAQPQPEALFGEGAVAAQASADFFVAGSVEDLGH